MLLDFARSRRLRIADKLSIDFKTKVLKVSEGCLQDIPGTSKSFLAKETLYIIEEIRRARLEEKIGQYLEMKREAVCAVRRDKKVQVVEPARQWRATCCQLTLDVLTEES